MNNGWGILFIAVVAATVWKLIERSRSGNKKPSGIKQGSPATSTPLKDFCQNAPSGGYDQNVAILFKAHDAEADGKYHVALGHLDKLIPLPEGIDAKEIVSTVTECFCGLYEDKNVSATLKGYDSLLAKHPAFAFAVENGGQDAMAETLATDFLDKFPEKSLVKKLLAFTKSEHALAKHFCIAQQIALAETLECAAEKELAGWVEYDTRKIPTEIFIAEMIEVFEGKKRIEETSIYSPS